MGVISAGKLDRRGTLQRLDTVQDAYGEPRQGWTDIAELWAEFTPGEGGAGGEAFSDAAEQRGARQPATFRIRYRAMVKPTMRLLFDGQVWEITDVAEVGRREGLLLTAFAREVESGKDS